MPTPVPDQILLIFEARRTLRRVTKFIRTSQQEKKNAQKEKTS
jgi:hypothetical protein